MLTSKQAMENQEKYGFNELTEGKKKSVFKIFLEQFLDFLVIILIVAAIVSGLLGEAESAVVIVFVITMNAILGTVQTVKAEQSLNSLKKLSMPEAKVIRDGELMKILSREVTVGDEVVIEAGDFIPADGKLLKLVGLQVDESALTGESIPADKSLEDVAEGAALGDQTNRVFAGCFVTNGHGNFVVEKIGMGTEVGKIAGYLNQASDKKTPLQKNMDDFGKKTFRNYTDLLRNHFFGKCFKRREYSRCLSFRCGACRGSNSGSIKLDHNDRAFLWNTEDGERACNYKKAAGS